MQPGKAQPQHQQPPAQLPSTETAAAGRPHTSLPPMQHRAPMSSAVITVSRLTALAGRSMQPSVHARRRKPPAKTRPTRSLDELQGRLAILGRAAPMGDGRGTQARRRLGNGSHGLIQATWLQCSAPFISPIVDVRGRLKPSSRTLP